MLISKSKTGLTEDFIKSTANVSARAVVVKLNCHEQHSESDKSLAIHCKMRQKKELIICT